MFECMYFLGAKFLGVIDMLMVVQQSLEYYGEWLVCPSNTVFLRIQRGKWTLAIHGGMRHAVSFSFNSEKTLVTDWIPIVHNYYLSMFNRKPQM